MIKASFNILVSRKENKYAKKKEVQWSLLTFGSRTIEEERNQP
jgi:hypothetical protein